MNDFTNDIPKYRKKSTARPPAKAKHKHVYEACFVEYPLDWWSKLHERKRYVPHLAFSSYCPICGKIGDVDRDRWFTAVKKYFGDGSHIESVKTEEAERELNPTTRTLPVFKIADPFVKFVDIDKEN